MTLVPDTEDWHPVSRLSIMEKATRSFVYVGDVKERKEAQSRHFHLEKG